MTDLITFNNIAVLVVLLIAAVIDVRTTKIPNKLTFPAAAVGIIANGVIGGWWGALMAVAGWFLGVALMMILNPKGKMGFGDVKLMATVGAFLGWQGVLICFLYFSIVYGAVSIFKLVSSIPWKQIFTAIQTCGGNIELAMKSIDLASCLETAKSRMALAPVMAIGVLIAIVLMEPTKWFLGMTK